MPTQGICEDGIGEEAQSVPSVLLTLLEEVTEPRGESIPQFGLPLYAQTTPMEMGDSSSVTQTDVLVLEANEGLFEAREAFETVISLDVVEEGEVNVIEGEINKEMWLLEM